MNWGSCQSPAAVTRATAAWVASSSSGNRCTYVSSVVLAEACPRRRSTTYTDAPLAISIDATPEGWACEDACVPTPRAWHPRSFVLTDIIDSVTLWERDPEAMAMAVGRHEELIAGAVAAAGGELVRTKGEGDSTFSVFDRPVDAITAAGAVQAAIGSEPWPPEAAVRVRCGVHTGDAEGRDGAWYGPAVNRAARLRGLAGGGQTLASGVTAGLVADRLPRDLWLVYRGRRALRGIERPEEVWELVGASDTLAAGHAWHAVGGLPIPLTTFVGRKAELAALAEVVDTRRLVTLTGAGGCGKTRLAQEAAAAAAGRGQTVWTIELAPLTDPKSVAGAVASAVGLESGPDPVAELVGAANVLAGLLVLDNCEHLVDACSGLAARLLAAAPELRILATSRAPLRVVGEQVWPIGSLNDAESVVLLLDRARAVRPDLDVSDEDDATLSRICHALDGLPLAIELAAGRLRSMSLAELADRLDDQLAVLTRRPAAGDEARHRTMRVALDVSYDLLAPEQREIAQRLSVFAGGFRLDAAEAVCGERDVLNGVDELVANSLVTFDGTTARYRLLEPLRQYFAKRLAESGAEAQTRCRHAQWIARLADRLGRQPLEAQGVNSRRLREEASNIDLSLEWALDNDEDLALRIVAALSVYWPIFDQASGRRWFGLVLARGTASSRPRARALLGAAEIAAGDEEWNRALDWFKEALAIYRARGSIRGEAASLFGLGRLLGGVPDRPGGRAEATECLTQGARLYAQVGDVPGAAWCRVALAFEAVARDDLAAVERVAVEVIENCEAAGVRHPAGQALYLRAYLARESGDDNAAVAYLQEAAGLYRDLGDPARLAGMLGDLAAEQARLGQPREALQNLAAMARLAKETGRSADVPLILTIAAVIHAEGGDPALMLAAIAAYEAHPESRAAARIDPRPTSVLHRLTDAVNAARAQVDPAELADATAAARRKGVSRLVDELILRPAAAAQERAGATLRR